MRRLKTLHVITDLDVGGTELMLTRLLPALQDSFEVACCSVFPLGPVAEVLRQHNIRVYSLNFKHKWDVLVIWRLYRLLRQLKPDILITHLIHSDLIGRVIGRLAGVKTIVCSQQGSLLQWEFLRYFDRLTKNLVTHYIVQTSVAANEISQKLTLSPTRLTVIPNSIQKLTVVDNRDATRQTLGLSSDEIVLICVARLRRKKGHEYLLEAFEQLYQEHPNIRLLLVGDGERETELKKLVSRLSAQSAIHFLGNRRDVPELLRAADIFVLPTLAEGMSNAIMEAMMAGKASVVTDIPVNQVLVTDNQTGLLCQTADSHSLYQQLHRLISDEELRQRLGLAAQQFVEQQFDPALVARTWHETLITVREAR